MSSVCLSRRHRRESRLTPDSIVRHFIDDEAQIDEDEDEDEDEEEEESGVSTYLSPCNSLSLTGIPRFHRRRL